MAQIASDAIRAAKDRASKAAALVDRMQPYVGRRYDEDSVSAWITGRTVPPGDALLAAAKATDLSLDARLLPPELASNDADLQDRHADVTHVFATRSDFASQLPPQRLFDGAQQIDACGLSLNLLCQQYTTDALRKLLESGCTIRCAFLAPRESAIHAREKEENYPRDHLSGLTQLNIDILLALRRSLPARVQQRLQVGTYNTLIRFHVIVVNNGIAVVQPYLPGIRGVDSPTLVMRRREADNGLFPTFVKVFESVWDQCTSL